jgi:UTP--glucose-1-phosphate uridylyltransferase
MAPPRLPLTKAVIPAAGLGTRFLPASKAIPKEMLPLVDKPAIQWVLEEADAAGLSQRAVITAQGKDAMRDHFAPAPALDAALEAKGDSVRLEALSQLASLGEPTWIVQDHARGLGHAIGCAESFVDGEPFAVLLGDDLLDPHNPMLPAMAAVRARVGGTVLLLLEVPDSMTHLYGVVETAPAPADLGDDPHLAGLEIHRITRLQEKPAPGEAMSNLAVIGRYVLDPAVFDVLRSTAPGRGGEIQITDAIHTLASMDASEGGGVHGIVFRGSRYDTGDKLEYLKAVVQLAAKDPRLGSDFSAWLREFEPGAGHRP